jgi:ABC-2 type transport system ATP-binding protein
LEEKNVKVEFQKIQKHFKEVDVLKEVNLVVESGKIMCLLGPSGSGKTTLIRILIGAIKADSGVVKVGELTMPNMAAMWKSGFMPQNDGVYNDISGLDNLMFYGKLYSMKKEKLKARIKELLEMLNLWEDRNKLVANYSGGMKKRLSLAIAILHEPELLVLDEPTVGIDPMLRKVIWEEFHKLKKQGKTIIVSTHVMDEVKQCDSASLLYMGKIIETGTVDELFARTASGNIEELFLRSSEEDKL